MLEPTVALATAIRSRLISTSTVTDLVAADQIRAGSMRPDKLPAVLMANGQTIFLGNAAGSQLLARVFLDLHVWAIGDGAETAQAIGYAVLNALRTAPGSLDFVIDDYTLPAVRWMRDPDPQQHLTHGVLTVEAVMRWASDGAPIGSGDTGAPSVADFANEVEEQINDDLPDLSLIFENKLI